MIQKKKCSACRFVRLLLISLTLAGISTWLADMAGLTVMSAMMCGVVAALIPFLISGWISKGISR
jgi:pheromone shutdown protein TraB